ncbi:MAG: sugar phosphate isomerase/epimerase [Chloroflexi bacterium]|nr:sugar phosphate isomerase/epimerase [Chloroflexota bacterium]
MRIGIMARTFVRPTLQENLDAVQAHSIRCVQYGFSCAGLPEMPERIDPALCDLIRREMEARGITMSAISGTFNMIHPDLGVRQDGLRRLEALAAACGRLGTSVITLCTGTRNLESMWRRHPDNDSAEAWRDMLASMARALRSAEDHGVTLAFEPEVSNVVDSAHKARRLLDEMRSPYLKVVMDAANIFHAGELVRMREIVDEAFDLLGGDVALAHAKDLDRDGEAGHIAAGKGRLDYDQYLSRLAALPGDLSLILHGLAESEVDGCVAFLAASPHLSRADTPV